MKLSVFMDKLNNENGFSLITALTMLSFILLTLPFLGATLQLTKPVNNHQELAVHEFFRFIRDDIIKSHETSIADDALYLYQNKDDTVVISQYNNVIRRQVNRAGHEIYLRNVKKLRMYEQAHGIKIVVTTEDGVNYEKLFNIYEEI